MILFIVMSIFRFGGGRKGRKGGGGVGVFDDLGTRIILSWAKPQGSHVIRKLIIKTQSLL